MKSTRIKFTYIHFFKESLYHFFMKKGYSEKNILQLFSNQCITVNGAIILDKRYILPFKKVKIEVVLCDEESSLPVYPENINILYEDPYLLIVDKPSNMDIEPTKANYENNLACRILSYYKEKNIHSKIHFVNRLDKMTSGLVIVAKNQYIHHLFSKINIKKFYIAKVEGKTPKKGTIKIKIKKSSDSMKRIVSPDGKKCVTQYKRIFYQDNESLVKIRLLTGRTHQIRVSFLFIGHPLVNDMLYNPRSSAKEFYLRAYKVVFKHPVTKKLCNFTYKF